MGTSEAQSQFITNDGNVALASAAHVFSNMSGTVNDQVLKDWSAQDEAYLVASGWTR